MSETLEALVDLILAAYREPLRYQERLKGPLPEPFLQVLRLAAGKPLPGVELFCQQEKTSLEELRKAAIFFIEQACLSEKQDSYRILGVNPGAAPYRLQEHYHLLMLLFHPDRVGASESWRGAYAAQVNEAYHRLRKPANRQVYDCQLATQRMRQKAREPVYGYQHSHSQEKKHFLTYLIQRFPRAIRYLPQLVLGGGILATSVLVASLYFSMQETTPVAFSMEGEVSPKASVSPQGIAVEPGDAPPLTVRGMGLPLAEERIASLNQSAAKQRERVTAEQARFLKTAVVSGKQAWADNSPEALTPIDSGLKSRPLQAQVLLAKSPPVSPDPVANDGSVNGSAPEKIVSAATGESSSEQNAALANSQAPAPTLQQEALQGLIQRFIRAYQRGDLEGFLTLFSPDARTDDYSGWSAIRQDYRRLFTSTQRRELQLQGLRWLIDGNIANGKGHYIARIRNATGTFEIRGQIHFQVQNRQETGLITGLFYTVDGQWDVFTPD